MIILQVMWIDIILTFICSGYIGFASILYCISLVVLGLMVHLHKTLIHCIKIKEKEIINDLPLITSLFPIGKNTYINILMSTIIHSIISVSLLGMPLLGLGIVILSIYRIKNEKDLEELVCQK